MLRKTFLITIALMLSLSLGACVNLHGLFTSQETAGQSDTASENDTQAQTEDADENEVDSQIDIVRELIADGNYDTALAKIESIYIKDITSYQKKELDELKKTVETAEAKISDTAKTSSSNTSSNVTYNATANTNVVATYYVVNCKEWITLRAAPSTSAGSLAHIPLGQSVGYIENAGNGFYKINYDGKIGYGLAAYLSNTKPNVTSNVSSNNSSYSRTAKVVNCNEWITLRSTPSTSGNSLGHIPLGAYVKYISTAENGFYCIEYNGQRGYALQSYLALQ